MNFFEKWFLKRIFAREVTQGYTHASNITRIYCMVREAARAEFTEDSDASLDAFLQERFALSKKFRGKP